MGFPYINFNSVIIQWMRSATNKTITLPTAYTTKYRIVGSLCRNETGWQIGSGVVCFGNLELTSFKAATIWNDNTAGDICNIISIGY